MADSQGLKPAGNGGDIEGVHWILRRGFDAAGWQPYLRGMTNLELTEVQKEALIRELSQIVQNDRYPLSPRIVVLREILGQLRPEPAREPLPPRQHYEPPSKGRYGRRRG